MLIMYSCFLWGYYPSYGSFLLPTRYVYHSISISYLLLSLWLRWQSMKAVHEAKGAGSLQSGGGEGGPLTPQWSFSSYSQ